MKLEEFRAYRILHIDNLEWIFKHQSITNKNDRHCNKNYINIGNDVLISKREGIIITTQHSNNKYIPSSDFIPFYIGQRSVMLYMINSGRDVAFFPSEKIIYIVINMKDIVNNSENKYLFTDGHGFAKITQWYDSVKFLKNIEKLDVARKEWNNTPEDPDRQRRKQAEVWIKQPIAIELINCIVTYNQESYDIVKTLKEQYKIQIPVKIDQGYYY